ncbi:MAG: hypothetical protein WCY41_06395 [Candidatus Micrarchaeia archaeon]
MTTKQSVPVTPAIQNNGNGPAKMYAVIARNGARFTVSTVLSSKPGNGVVADFRKTSPNACSSKTVAKELPRGLFQGAMVGSASMDIEKESGKGKCTFIVTNSENLLDLTHGEKWLAQMEFFKLILAREMKDHCGATFIKVIATSRGYAFSMAEAELKGETAKKGAMPLRLEDVIANLERRIEGLLGERPHFF